MKRVLAAAGVLAAVVFGVGMAPAHATSSPTGAFAWGSNNYGPTEGGPIGNGTTTNSDVPVAVDTSGALNGKTVTHISAGYQHTCAVTSDGGAYCWGWNSDGQLGNGSTTNSDVPSAVDTSGVLNGKTVTEISAGQYHTCAIASDGNAYCWGKTQSATSATAPRPGPMSR